MVNTAKPITIYSNRACPYAQRALIALYETGLEHELVEIPLPNKPSWYLDINPEGKVPALKYGDDILAESLVIAEFITDLSDKSFLPQDPLKRAQARFAIEFWGSKIVPILYRLLRVSDSAEIDTTTNELVEHLKRFNALLAAQSDGPYFFGDQYSLVEIVLSPFIGRLAPTVKFARINIPKTPELTRFHSWTAEILERPSFQKSSLSAEELYEKTEQLATKIRALA
ncbi:glutathione S-transferase [Basidiobolus meristosporus CBS 931.73]|uniref:Glutathione S-transferase n=1 Tax=Basidiobolus meristosporus CBS 931.73 TaxID=1314790 RepID=A0A1Y1XF03_9FUNG|nr:glutathione S-transferase [Basidiobolus meristosporus CBS 931.73]|eukprot:ORX84361.1 glutathione S-transferase [Basidiobolus meristosporus CBS 931.73]